MSLSLEHALSAHLISSEECKRRYWSGLALSGRLLGYSPMGFFRIMDLSPLTADGLTLLRPSFRIPACELGLTALSPRQRRIALLEGSRTHGTPYCTSHCASIGDMLKGPLVQQCIRAGSIEQVIGVEEDGDDLIRKLVKEACSFPVRMNAETKTAFVEKFGEQGLHELTTMLSFMGWLNFCNDIAGMELERNIAAFSELVLPREELPSQVDYTVAEQGDDANARKDASMVSSGSTGIWKRFQSYVQNVWWVATLVPAFLDADMQERALFKGIPNEANEMPEWVVRNFGCQLQLFENVPDVTLLRQLAFGCKLVFLRHEISTWKPLEKFAFLYVFGKRTGNPTLVDDSISLLTGHRMLEKKLPTTARVVSSHELWNPTAKKVQEELEEIFADAASENEAMGAFSAALKFMFAGAGPAGGVSEQVMRQALDKISSPGAVVDLIGMSGMFAYFHRTCVLMKAR